MINIQRFKNKVVQVSLNVMTSHVMDSYARKKLTPVCIKVHMDKLFSYRHQAH